MITQSVKLSSHGSKALRSTLNRRDTTKMKVFYFMIIWSDFDSFICPPLIGCYNLYHYRRARNTYDSMLKYLFNLFFSSPITKEDTTKDGSLNHLMISLYDCFFKNVQLISNRMAISCNNYRLFYSIFGTDFLCACRHRFSPFWACERSNWERDFALLHIPRLIVNESLFPRGEQ